MNSVAVIDETPMTAMASAPPVPGLVNAVMLITWPQRRAMIQHAVLSFVRQDHPLKTLTIVNDGLPCGLSARGARACGCTQPWPSRLARVPVADYLYDC